MTGAHALMAMSAVVLLVFVLSRPFAVRRIVQLSRQQPEGAEGMALGLVFLLFEVFFAVGVLYP